MSGKHRLQREERIVPLGALAAGGVLSFMLGAVIVSQPATSEPPVSIATAAAPTVTPTVDSTLVVPTPISTPTTVEAPVTTAATVTRTVPTTTVVEETYTPQLSASGSNLVDAAREYIGDGIPYLYGGKDESGMDCSAFIWHVLRDEGFDVPYRNSVALKAWTTPVSAADARPGDLVFWDGHVGLYPGSGDVIDMASGPGTVTERALWGTPTFGRLP